MANNLQHPRSVAWSRLALLLALLVVGSHTLRAQESGTAPAPVEIGLDEHLGQFLPADAMFYDEHGVRRTLGELIDRPTIVALIFFHCPGVCGLIQGNLAAALTRIRDMAGEDYQVLSISFDDEEGPDLALEAKGNYLRILGTNLPDRAWRFLTGDRATIHRVTETVGFKFLQNGKHDFTHPNLITVVGADRKIIRYLYGTDYLPVEITMALTEAARGTPGVSIRKVLSYCFTYDSENKRYAFRLLRVVGVATLVCVGLFLVFLLRKGGRRGAGSA